jgi:hypothetical protein
METEEALIEPLVAQMRAYVEKLHPEYKIETSLSPAEQYHNYARAISRIMTRYASGPLQLTDMMDATVLCTGKYGALREYFTGITIGMLASLSGDSLMDAVVLRVFVQEHRAFLQGSKTTPLLRPLSTASSRFSTLPSSSGTPDIMGESKFATLQRKFVSAASAPFRPFDAQELTTFTVDALLKEAAACGPLGEIRVLDLRRNFLMDDDLPIVSTAMQALPKCTRLDLSWIRQLGCGPMSDTSAPAKEESLCVIGADSIRNLLKSRTKLVVSVVGTGFMNVDCAHTLYDKLKLSELRRLV